MRIIGFALLFVLLGCSSVFAKVTNTYTVAIHQINSESGYTATCSDAVSECSIFMTLNTPREDKNLTVRILPGKNEVQFDFEWAGKNLDAIYANRHQAIFTHPGKTEQQIVQLIIPDAAMEEDQASHLYQGLVIHKSNDVLAQLEVVVKSQLDSAH
jgi:hypothetical protein